VRLVVDASVIVPCFVPERFSAAARSWLDAADLLLAPELLALECANALWKKVRRGEITLNDATIALEKVLGGLIELHPSATLAQAAFAGPAIWPIQSMTAPISPSPTSKGRNF
jgi:predicted nucleic acid-binding protein